MANRLTCKTGDLEERLEALLQQRSELEKQIKRFEQAAAAGAAEEAAKNAIDLGNGLQAIIAAVAAPNPNELRGMATSLCKKIGEGVVVLGAEFGDKVTVCANVTPKAIETGHKAGDIIRDITGKLGGKGGGKPNFAMGGAPNNGKLAEVLAGHTL